MLEWIWVCMVIALKATLGSFFWAVAIIIGFIGIASFFGIMGSLFELVTGGGKK